MIDKMLFEVNKAGYSEWYEVEALTGQDAIEQHFNVQVYPYELKYDVWVFDDMRDSVDQLYGARKINND